MLKQKRAEIGLGVIVTVAIAIIVGLILFQSVASNVENATRANTGVINVANTTITSGASGVITILTGQELVGTPVVTNSTGGEIVPATNYTIAECVRTTDNLKGICYTQKAGSYTTKSLNISYTYYPDGYIDDAGARSVTGLIIILVAIGVAMVAFLGIRKDII